MITLTRLTNSGSATKVPVWLWPSVVDKTTRDPVFQHDMSNQHPYYVDSFHFHLVAKETRRMTMWAIDRDINPWSRMTFRTLHFISCKFQTKPMLASCHTKTRYQQLLNISFLHHFINTSFSLVLRSHHRSLSKSCQTLHPSQVTISC